MQIHVLASSSSGNAVVFEIGGVTLLVDAGISARRITQGLEAAGIAASSVDALLITHEHIDHIKGMDVLCRRHHVPVYAREGAWDRIPFRDKIPAECRHTLGDSLTIRGVHIEPFAISHDAADPVGFCFYHHDKKYTLATDLGVVTPTVKDALAMADAAVLESNHDPQMLMEGPYPAYLKQRIRGRLGHLSNLEAGETLSDIPRKEGMQVFLAHLSQQNNLPGLAERTVKQALVQSGCDVGHDLILRRTYPDALSSLRL
jgi:phosphoribosyl 1,2-cyclic phosphodiesterase